MAIDRQQLQILLKTKGVKLSQAELAGLDTQVKTTERSFKGLMATMAGFAVAGVAISKVVGIGKDFEAQMKRVQAVSGASANELKTLSQQARDLGASTANTASEIAELQENFARLGFRTDEIIGMTEATQALAYATGQELGESAMQVGSTMKAFQLETAEAAHVTDIFAAATASSALNMTTLGDSLTYVAPVASGLGFSLEESVAMLGKLHDNAITGSMAGTQLRKIMLEMGTEGSKLAKKLGGPVKSAEEMAIAFDKLRKEGFDPVGEGAALVGKRAVAGFKVLFDNIGNVEDLTDVLNESSEAFGGLGFAQEQQRIMMDSLQGDLDKFNSALEGLALDVFDEFKDDLRSAVQAMTEFISETDIEDIKRYIVQLGVFAGVWKGLPALIGGYTAAMKFARTATISFNLTLATTPWGALAVGAALAAGALIKWYNSAEDGTEITKDYSKELQKLKSAQSGLSISQVDLSKSTIDINNLTSDSVDAAKKQIKAYEANIKSNEQLLKSEDNLANQYNSRVKDLKGLIQFSTNYAGSNKELKKSTDAIDKSIGEGTLADNLDELNKFLSLVGEELNKTANAAARNSSVAGQMGEKLKDVTEISNFFNASLSEGTEEFKNNVQQGKNIIETTEAQIASDRTQIVTLQEKIEAYNNLSVEERNQIELLNDFEKSIKRITDLEEKHNKKLTDKQEKQADLALIEARRIGIIDNITRSELEAAMASAKRGDSLDEIINNIINAGTEEERQGKKTIFYTQQVQEQKEELNKALTDTAIKYAIMKDAQDDSNLTNETTIQNIKDIIAAFNGIDPEQAVNLAFDVNFDENTIQQIQDNLTRLTDMGVGDKLALNLAFNMPDITSEQIDAIQQFIDEQGMSPEVAIKMVFDKEFAAEQAELQHQFADEFHQSFMEQTNTNELARLNAEHELQLKELEGHKDFHEKKKDIDRFYNKQRVMMAVNVANALMGAAGTYLQSIAGNEKESKKTRIDAIKQMKFIAKAGILTGMARAYEAGFPAGVGIAATVAANGAVQLKNLDNQIQKLQSAKVQQVNPQMTTTGTSFTTSFQDGGYVQGPSHSQGGVPAELEGGEFVMNRSAVDTFGRQMFDNMNNGGGAGNTVNVEVKVEAPLVDEHVIDVLIPAIREGVRKGHHVLPKSHRRLYSLIG